MGLHTSHDCWHRSYITRRNERVWQDRVPLAMLHAQQREAP